MRRWFGKIVPLQFLIGYVLLCLCAFVGPALWSAVWGPEGRDQSSVSILLQDKTANSESAPGTYVLPVLLIIGAVVYGAYRVAMFAPDKESPYYKALMTMPYDGRKPLPAGPLLFVPQDAVLILTSAVVAGGVAGPAWGAWVVAAFLISYSALAVVGLADARKGELSYVTAVCVFLSIRFVRTPWIVLPLACLTGVVAWFCLRHALRSFPWERKGEMDKDAKAHINSLVGLNQGDSQDPRQWEDDERERRAGWPLGLLAPRGDVVRITIGWALAWGLLLALALDSLWSAGSYPHPSRMRDPNDLAFVFSSLSVAAGGIVRLRIYNSRYLSPITFFGRLATGRLLVPSYDYVVLTPLVALMLHVLLTCPFWLADVSLRYIAPVSIGLALAILLGGPPSLANWSATGGHRISISTSNKLKKEHIQVS